MLFLKETSSEIDSSALRRYQLSTINPHINAECTNLRLGEKLCLGYPGQDCTTTYVVKAGDTCDSVEKAAGVDTTTFYANNPQLDDKCSNMYVGEVSVFCKFHSKVGSAYVSFFF